ncbi:hypothetical protein GGH19_002452 [Coemansia sp. RSA 1807]|nr:hypothetical protein LPJ58_000032 [Coemansia sp. RSA 1591]KAJ1768395.1 hypothetical protein LPJ69_000063 [Coemansia sp. RSA 1752]KAJ1795413.1 hypothetical protein LPJ67_000032 [Coemansia sp. RSA 1938]KAJ2154137.1 hypothetical protein J3F82_001447 [Coemansia sp. RSA 637]KAJ2261186.1 hypothetical protein EV176_006612 [Coemansia sp. RSA 451]KAJ2407892.1 hypothetical protein J3F80_002502 [Coemansia sp. RSA 2526]KAJ2447837.1 hypothetical protein IWW46_000011 [Coemansia sp. RSA 2440]KAJ2536613.
MQRAANTEETRLEQQPQSRTHTDGWSEAEKELVQATQNTGRKSLMHITRALNGTKTLRQVAEYIEYLEFWSRMLEQPADEAVFAEAEETSEEQITTEEIQSVQSGKDIDVQVKADAQALRTERNDTIDARHVQRLARSKRTNKSVRTLQDTVVCLDETLRSFVQHVVFHVSVEAELAGVTKVEPENISAALRASGLSPVLDSQ